MATNTQPEPAVLLRQVPDPKLKALLTELLRHVNHEAKRLKQDNGCG